MAKGASNETCPTRRLAEMMGLVIAFLEFHDQPCPPRIALTLVACAETRRGLLIVSALCLCPCFDCFSHFPSFHRQPHHSRLRRGPPGQHIGTPQGHDCKQTPPVPCIAYKTSSATSKVSRPGACSGVLL